MESYNYNWWAYNKEIMRDFNWFIYKINQRACINLGYLDEEYTNTNRKGKIDYGLAKNVEYFHPTITLDDRMRYIGKNIASANISNFNILGNTIISHFYGARGVHQTITGVNDPNNCWVDFDRVEKNDQDYIQLLRKTVEHETKVNKKPVWGTTELHTSIQGGARNYCREKYGDSTRKFHTTDVIEWVANFKTIGLADSLLYKCTHIKEAYDELTKLKGVGEYYGFHCAASTSVLPMVKYHHDQRFVSPGPGAKYTIKLLWPNAPAKLHPEAIYFLREQADKIGLIKGVNFHPNAYNIDDLFEFPQDGLKYYGTEVVSCQFGVYFQIRDDKKACDRRKISRINETSATLEKFFV